MMPNEFSTKLLVNGRLTPCDSDLHFHTLLTQTHKERNMATSSLSLGPFLTKGIVDTWANTSTDLRFGDPVIFMVIHII